MAIDNLILIKGGAYNDLKKALRQWIDLYSKDLQADFTFELYKNGLGGYIIQADKRLDNDRFYFLVNYLNYPIGINYTIQIEGFTTGKDKNVLKNQNLLVYISPNETDYDNVFVVTSENKNYQVDFGGKIKEVSEGKSYRFPNEITFNNPDVLTVDKSAIAAEQEPEDKSSIATRFRFILSIATFLFLANLLVSYFTPDFETIQLSTWFLVFGIGTWFLLDYEMLRIDNFYMLCFLVACCVLGYGHLIFKYIRPGVSESLLTISLCPMTILIVQWPTRRLYKFIFNREPKVERYGKVADLVYTLILAFGLGVLPFLIMELIK